VVSLWLTLSSFDRTRGQDGAVENLSISTIARFCEIYDLVDEEFHKLLLIEGLKYSSVRKKDIARIEEYRAQAQREAARKQKIGQGHAKNRNPHRHRRR